MSMFCFQCQEAAKGTGCTIKGVCGKTDDVANLQDLLIHTLKGIAVFSKALRDAGENNLPDHFIIEGLFVTITNANFDAEAISRHITEALIIRDELKKRAEVIGLKPEFASGDAASWFAEPALYGVKARNVGVLTTTDEDVRSLRELLMYGMKGVAAYTEHARNLGFKDETIYAFLEKGLVATLNDTLSADEQVGLVMECGKIGVSAMALLDKANTTRYGNPEITKVNIGVGIRPGILISGHDLKDMEELLAQTEGTGVDVYTHSEMLPANYYPAFKKYGHFVGNYGNAWWKQNEEFESFNGPVLFTTNCIVPPRASSTYADRVYTTGASGYPGFLHIADRSVDKPKDFSAIIEHAKHCAPPVEIEKGEIVGGFAHAQVFALADKVVDAVKSGAIRKFFVMAGCDGRMKSRDYYTEFAEKLPKDTVILTAGCAKYRYNKLALGDIGGIPRVLDAGQCNDSYSLVVIAMKLKEVFQLNDINDLPIAYNIAWYEQKAVIVLLALLYLGVKKIHLGPSLPAFLSPNVATVLVNTFGIAPIGSVDDDMKLFLN
ncbi:MAG TPA: hydroxylamine reductase [Bacteroidales bacterium]|nr:MAG: hydroxylamine reductase [Bacteroidetes bacterium GWE2_42_24]OFY31622.1 MAG: hydroxylamine reductase [Bacteroidetes bacterium GWF2_43_11]HAQ64430.1 hydroxylamine reductase [Bacteroidales bacterium]HBZ67120.1 hydroxylamine reductase [Bacteroidales bacterium]